MIYGISNKLRKNGLCFTLFFAMILFMLLTPSFEYITTIHAGAATSLTGTKVNVKSPTANLKKGTYYSNQSIRLSCDTKGAIIYYTMDNTKPTTKAKKYTEEMKLK